MFSVALKISSNLTLIHMTVQYKSLYSQKNQFDVTTNSHGKVFVHDHGMLSAYIIVKVMMTEYITNGIV